MRSAWWLAAFAALGLAGCDWIKSPGGKEVNPPTELTEFAPSLEVSRAWSRNLGDGAGKSAFKLRPAYGDGVLFASDASGTVAAIDAGSGAQRWRVELPQPASSGPGTGDGLVVVGGVEGGVYALSAADGSERWTARASSEVLAPPAVSGGVVVVRAQDGRLFGFDAADGNRRWVFDRGVPLLTLRGSGAPVIADGVVYAGYDNGKVVALNLSDGVLRWEQTLAQPDGRTELERMVDIDGELAFGNGELFAASYRGQVGALTPDNGRVVWSRDFSSAAGVALAGDKLVVVGEDGAVAALDVRSGTALWKQEGLAWRWPGSPVVVGGHVLVGDFEGWLHWLSLEDGSFSARQRMGDEGIRATPLVVGDVVYVASAEGELAAWRVGG
jgi:outer membrane protein assembly factor BamB